MDPAVHFATLLIHLMNRGPRLKSSPRVVGRPVRAKPGRRPTAGQRPHRWRSLQSKCRSVYLVGELSSGCLHEDVHGALVGLRQFFESVGGKAPPSPAGGDHDPPLLLSVSGANCSLVLAVCSCSAASCGSHVSQPPPLRWPAWSCSRCSKTPMRAC
jgi:hypothetical protein